MIFLKLMFAFGVAPVFPIYVIEKSSFLRGEESLSRHLVSLMLNFGLVGAFIAG